MKRLIRIVAGLYPRSWQERYGAEFAALLEDVDPDWGTSVDILKGALEMQIRGLSFAKILMTAGVAGVLAAAGARFAIPTRAEAVIAVRGPAKSGPAKSGPMDEATARDAVLSLAKQTFKHVSLTSVTTQEALSPDVGTPAFSVAFTYDDPHDGLRSVLAFVREHAGPPAPGELQILTVSSRASNRWLIPLIGLRVQAASFSKNRLIGIFAAVIVPPIRASLSLATSQPANWSGAGDRFLSPASRQDKRMTGEIEVGLRRLQRSECARTLIALLL